MSATDGELLAIAVEAARSGAAVLMDRYSRAPEEVHTKSSPTDPVSEADLTAEREIREVLARRRPDDAVLGEEGTDVAGTSALRWLVDPLDGTVNYLYRFPQWCVSIACVDHAAVVLDPVHDELFTAVAGGPACLDGVPLRRRGADSLATALVATGFGYDAHVRAAQAAVAERVLPRVRDIRRAGSAALDLAWTAAGRCDAYYERGVKPWDVAAGAMLCRAAGLVVRDLPERDGLPAGLLAAPPAIADDLLALVA
ncbi:MAG TPA: inositol monophosphatase family protein [Solirubrobacteraceae bacterium]|nr:inositol monophosphatase family protein [Solirubrobacteraceae bacterium]